MIGYKKRYPSKAAKRRAERPEPEGLVAASARAFREAVDGGKPTVVLFGASWCGPCAVVKPDVNEEARKRPKVTALYLSLDDIQVQGIASEYSVMGVPMLMAFRGGRPVDQRLASRKAIGPVFDLAEGKQS